MKFKNCLAIVILVLLSFGCEKEEQASGCKPYKPAAGLDTYIFPLVPGMSEWANLKTGDEMVAVTQVPKEKLDNISTKGLVETCATYPLRFNILTHTYFQRGVEGVLNRFNGFEELKKRSDVAQVLLARYQQMDPVCYGGIIEGELQGEYTLDYAYFEATMLAQNIFLEKFTKTEKQALMQLALEHYEKKTGESDEIWGGFNRMCTAIIMARVMVSEDYDPFIKAIQRDHDLKMFVELIHLDNLNKRDVILDVIANHARSFL